MGIEWALASMVASLLISIALTPKPASAKPPTFDDSNIPQIEDGTPQTVYFGECWTGDWQVLGYGDMRTSKIKASQAKK
ncbi:hypothetical protein I5F08_16825 [Proteus mirabilis]|nr:hypothetical protein [Proteus mirabilis]